MKFLLKTSKILIFFLTVSVFLVIRVAFAQTTTDDTVYLPLISSGSYSPPPTPAPTSGPGQANIIDHYAVAEFDAIPANYIQAAIQLTSLFRHASQGANINDGLDCLGNMVTPRPYSCDAGLDPDEIFYDEMYDRSNWDFEFHAEVNPNPGWWDKVYKFIDRVNGLPLNSYDFVSFKFGYVDGIEGSNIDDKFFNNDPNDNFPSIEDLEALEAAHPDKTLVLWTMGLARVIGTADAASFNQQMRNYAIENDKVLMDIGDILSHDLNGARCTYNGYEAICAEYTNETEGGHLNARGMQHMAKAYWVLMARLAGWETGTSLIPTPISTPTPTATAIPTTVPTTPPPGPTLSPTPTSTSNPPQVNIIDHNAVTEFDQIPTSYIQIASQQTSLFRHASVGGNINDGLDCLGNVNIPRPYSCDRGLDPDEVFYDEMYDRSNWDFEYHAEINPNPGWWDKLYYFVDRVNGLPTNSYDFVSFKFGYVDGISGANIDNKFFNNDPDDNFPSIEDLEALEAAHPDKTLILWTMGLARIIGTGDAASFNQQMRNYAIENDKILMDIGDILSHDPSGALCTYNGYEALCAEYTDETEGGHLNARGMQRMAKAYWVMMAKLSGWEGAP